MTPDERTEEIKKAVLLEKLKSVLDDIKGMARPRREMK